MHLCSPLIYFSVTWLIKFEIGKFCLNLKCLLTGIRFQFRFGLYRRQEHPSVNINIGEEPQKREPNTDVKRQIRNIRSGRIGKLKKNPQVHQIRTLIYLLETCLLQTLSPFFL